MIRASCVLIFIAVAAIAWADDKVKQETVKIREDFIPAKESTDLDAKAIGIIVSECIAVQGIAGRGSQPDAVCFSTANKGYFWMYVPTEDANAQITNFKIEGKGGKSKKFAKLNMATLDRLKPFGVSAKYSLAQVDVNDGIGSPGGEAFAATAIKVLDGTKEYPIKVAEQIETLTKKYEAHLKDQQKTIDKAMDNAEKDALQGQKRTGPRETKTIMYVTWLPDSEQLRVAYQTRISDGAFRKIQGGGIRRRDRVPPPPDAGQPPPPPPPMEVTIGTKFGVDLGTAYRVSKKGVLELVETLPIKSFQEELMPPP